MYSQGPSKPGKTAMAVYEFSKRYFQENHCVPTYREIGQGVGLSSTSTVYGHMKTLDRHGMVRHRPNSPRGFTIIGIPSVTDAERVEAVRAYLQSVAPDSPGAELAAEVLAMLGGEA